MRLRRGSVSQGLGRGGGSPAPFFNFGDGKYCISCLVRSDLNCEAQYLSLEIN